MPGPRVFTRDEADALVPDLERALQTADRLRERLRATKIKLDALEMIWGSRLLEPDCTDAREGRALLKVLKETQEEIAAVVQGLASRGATVKDLGEGLIDLLHVRDGILVCLCWKRGEEAFGAWHHVDAGFADRQSLDED